MPQGKDSYQALPGHEKLTWVDHLRALTKSDMLRTNPETGATENPRREYMRQQIEQRTRQEREAAEAAKRRS